VLLVETSGQTEICQLDVAASVEKDVVRFDITTMVIACATIFIKIELTDG